MDKKNSDKKKALKTTITAATYNAVRRLVKLLKRR